MLSNEVLYSLQHQLGYHFKDIRQLKVALTHKSYLTEKKRDPEITEQNERLEFLGDAVLELIVTEYLYINFTEPEGHLTSLRSSLVNYRIMGDIGKDIGLQDIILLSKSEKEELGQARLTIVADCMESVIGAMYLDGGYLPCKNFVKKWIISKLPEIIADESYKDAKTKLQEFAQKKYKQTPKYKILASEGLDHNKVFVAGVYVLEELIAKGEGRSKQDAEVEAATKAIDLFEKQPKLYVG